MKRKAATEDDGNNEEQLFKRRYQESSSNTDLNEQQKQIQPQQPPSPLSQSLENQIANCEQATNASAICDPSEFEKKILEWIPDEVEQLEDMSQPPSKRSRSASVSSDASTSSRDAKSSAYKDTNYVAILEQKSCFMLPSTAGPVPEDIELCARLLRQTNEVPSGTLFDDEYVEPFHDALRNRSEARLSVDLHPLLMPSAENRFIQGREGLNNVIDGYNDPWLKTEPIHGPKPQPDHTWGLKWSTFSVLQRRKLGIKPDEKSMYAVREDIYFPYTTAEIKCGNQALEFADRQNMHSMCIALRAVVSLAQAAECLVELHGRILGFSISHDSEDVRIYAYYPEINEGKVQYYRWPVKRFNIWSKDERWLCYQFVENVNREFLPTHVARLSHFLEEIVDPLEYTFELEDDQETDSRASRVDSQGRSVYSRAPSSQNRGLNAELRSMIHNLQQQLEEQRAEQKAREAEQRAREEKLVTQMEELKAREEELLRRLLTHFERNQNPG